MFAEVFGFIPFRRKRLWLWSRKERKRNERRRDGRKWPSRSLDLTVHSNTPTQPWCVVIFTVDDIHRSDWRPWSSRFQPTLLCWGRVPPAQRPVHLTSLKLKKQLLTAVALPQVHATGTLHQLHMWNQSVKYQCKAKEMNLPPADVTRLMKRTVDLRRSFILTAPLTESCSSTRENV